MVGIEFLCLGCEPGFEKGIRPRATRSACPGLGLMSRGWGTILGFDSTCAHWKIRTIFYGRKFDITGGVSETRRRHHPNFFHAHVEARLSSQGSHIRKSETLTNIGYAYDPFLAQIVYIIEILDDELLR